MKIRVGFVSNSSSSSFVAMGFKYNDSIKELYNKLFGDDVDEYIEKEIKKLEEEIWDYSKEKAEKLKNKNEDEIIDVLFQRIYRYLEKEFGLNISFNEIEDGFDGDGIYIYKDLFADEDLFIDEDETECGFNNLSLSEVVKPIEKIKEVLDKKDSETKIYSGLRMI